MPNAVLTIDDAETLLCGVLSDTRIKSADTDIAAHIQGVLSPPPTAGARGPITDPVYGTANAALIGTGIGGALGLGRALINPERRKRWLSSALQGALLGGGVGAGLGAGIHGYNWFNNGPRPPANNGGGGNSDGLADIPRNVVNQVRSYLNNDQRGYAERVNAARGNRDVTGTAAAAFGVPNPDAPGTAALSAIGGGGGAVAGGIVGRALDRRAADAPHRAALQTYNTQTVPNHAAATQAHSDALNSYLANTRDRLIDLANNTTGRSPLARTFNEPLASNGPTRLDLLRNAPRAAVTAQQLRMTPAEFNSLTNSARQHGQTTYADPSRPAAPGPLPPPPEAPTNVRTPWRRTGTGALVGGFLGMHGLNALFHQPPEAPAGARP